jgi:ectoine hydroxylase-related dioxygenase (phytanoyl-CoA dioxygenase family)
MTANGEPPIALTEAQLASFRRDGFVRVEALADDAECAALLGLYDALFGRAGGFEAGDRLELNADLSQAPLPQIVNPERYEPRLVGGRAYRNAQAIARQVLGDGCRPTAHHAILKPARIGGATPWHQDEAYWDPNFDHRAVSIWLALQPATLENGCMSFIAGSHRGPVLAHALISADSHGLRLSGPDPDLPAVSCELPAGSATVHDGRTLHAAGPNRSGEPRRALVFGFGLEPAPRAVPHHYPWQRPEWSQPLSRGN